MRSGELRALAERLAASLPPLAKEIVLTGSTSRGVADELSDIELLVVSDELPPLDVCVRAAGFQDADTWTPDGSVWWIRGLLEDEPAELIWWPAARVDRRVAEILAGDAFDHQRLRTAEAIVNGVPLRTAGAHAMWLDLLSDYPEELAQRVVADAVESWHESPRSVLTFLRPGERLPLARQLVEDAENVLRVVFALNRAWEPGWKRLEMSTAPLAIKPERLAARIDAALAGNDLRRMRELVCDALDLCPPTPTVARAKRELARLLEVLR